LRRAGRGCGRFNLFFFFWFLFFFQKDLGVEKVNDRDKEPPFPPPVHRRIASWYAIINAPTPGVDRAGSEKITCPLAPGFA